MILSRNPLLKPASSRSVLAQMPFAHVGSLIILVLHQLRKNVKPAVEWHAVPRAPVNVRPCARHERRPRRRANRMRDIGPLEDYRFRCKLVEIRRVNLDAPVASKCIGSLLVGQKENQVRLASCGHDFFRSRTKSALIHICNRAVSSPLPSEGRGLG